MTFYVMVIRAVGLLLPSTVTGAREKRRRCVGWNLKLREWNKLDVRARGEHRAFIQCGSIPGSFKHGKMFGGKLSLRSFLHFFG